MRRRPVGVIGLVLVMAVVACAVFGALFQEPGARRVSSLVEYLGCRSVLAVFAHADDEILVAATLADAAKHGCDVRTVTATRGEKGVPKGFSGDQAQLVRAREAELRRFGSELGIREQVLWDFPDGQLHEVPIEVLRDSIFEAIRRYQPELVLTLDPVAGFTGHPDHRRIGEAATLAALRAADSPPATVGEAPSPRWLAQAVFPRRAAVLVPIEELRRRLRQQPRTDVAVTGNLRVKLLGMRIHRTQQQYFPPAWFRSVLYRFYDREHFSLTRLDHHSWLSLERVE